MLYADKQRLEQNLALRLLQLRQKELAHLTQCCFTLASPAALLAGFAYIGMSQVDVPMDTPWWLVTLFFELNMLAMVTQIAATIRASYVALLGPALALRGRPGSMHRAVEKMGPCFMGAWAYFLVGLLFIFLATMVNLFIQPRFLFNSIISACLVLVGMVAIVLDMASLHAQFNLPEEQIVGAGFSRAEISTIIRQCAADAVQAATPVASAERPRSRFVNLASTRCSFSAAAATVEQQARTPTGPQSPHQLAPSLPGVRGGGLPVPQRRLQRLQSAFFLRATREISHSHAARPTGQRWSN
jgi:hypothetical protein